MNILPPVVDTQSDLRNYNVPLYGIKGEFSLSPQVKVPYFTCLMDLNRVTQELKTHEEINPSLDTTYSLVELFQRQIDIDRVRREIVEGYLRVPNKLKFFNSLTIVLLPKSKDGKIVSEFQDYVNNDPPIPDTQFGAFDSFFAADQGADKKAVFGGVQFVTTKTENLARLRWDKNRVDAVAVDGQHRLRALKLWMETKNNQLSDIERPTRIPIIFLMLHANAGFVGGTTGNTTGIKGIAREIFTDLNKNAREVDLATQIILDDLSVESCCVRSLVTPTTCTDAPGLLPLTLLRWQEANNRFDQRYYLNSLVNLHLLVKDLLILPSVDPMSKSDVLNFIKHVSKLLGTGAQRQLLHNGVSLEQHYKSEYFEGDEQDIAVAPFSAIPSHYLPSAVEGFKSYFSPWLIPLLKDFAPYKELITYAKENNLIEGEFGQYLSQPKTHQEVLSKDLAAKHGDHWRKIVIDDHNVAIEKIKGIGSELGEQWAFKTIFQKAVVRLGKILFVDSAENERARFGSVKEYIDFLDRLYKADVLRVLAPLDEEYHGLWTFIAVNYGGKKIRVSATSEARILNVLTMWYFGVRFANAEGKTISLEQSDSTITPKEILTKLWQKKAQASWPGINDQIESLQSLFSNPTNAREIARSADDLTPEQCQTFAKKRVEQVFQEGLRHFLGHSHASNS